MAIKKYEISLSEKQLEQVNKVLDLLSFGGEVELKEVEEIEQEEEQFPRMNFGYHYLTNRGRVEYDVWKDDSVDRDRLAFGNCFDREEDALFELERLKVINEMKEFAETENTKWEDKGVNHYYIYYNYITGFLHVSCKVCSKSNDIYFESREKAEECINAVGGQRIKQYYCEVEE